MLKKDGEKLNRIVIVFKNNKNALKYIPLIYIFFTFLFLMLRFPEEASTGVKTGIDLCFESLIPSLYPFMVIVELLSNTGLFTKNNHVFNFLSQKLFSLPHSFSIFILSCLGGYPVGAICIDSLVKKDVISKSAGERILLFTVNPSLNFAVSFVGVVLYKSVKAGLLLYLSNILTSLIIGIVMRFFNTESKREQVLPLLDIETSFAAAFNSAVKKSAVSMFYICAFTVIFSSLCALLETLPFLGELKLVFKCIAEVTNGVQSASKVCSLPFIASVMSFGGLSVAFQIFSSLTELKISSIKYFSIRILSSILSYLIALLLFNIFPVTVSTFSTAETSSGALTSHSVPVSIGLILMTVIFICEESFIKTKKT